MPQVPSRITVDRWRFLTCLAASLAVASLPAGISALVRHGRARLGALPGGIPTEGRSSVSAEQRENLDAILRIDDNSTLRLDLGRFCARALQKSARRIGTTQKSRRWGWLSGAIPAGMSHRD